MHQSRVVRTSSSTARTASAVMSPQKGSRAIYIERYDFVGCFLCLEVKVDFGKIMNGVRIA